MVAVKIYPNPLELWESLEIPSFRAIMKVLTVVKVQSARHEFASLKIYLNTHHIVLNH